MEKSNSHISYICHLKRELHTYLFLIKPYTLLLLSIFFINLIPLIFVLVLIWVGVPTFFFFFSFLFFLGNTETEETGKIIKEDF